MTTVTNDEIAQARSALASDPSADAALLIIEENKGNLDNAFEALLISSGVIDQVDRSGDSTYLEQFAQRCRNVICQEEFKEGLEEFSREALNMLLQLVAVQMVLAGMPAALAVPIVMYVVKLGIKRYCKPDDSES